MQDLAVMKKFVIVELEENREFNFPSGKTTSNMNMGQIIQIAFELRNITQAALDDESSSADESEGEESIANAKRRQEMKHWFAFCRGKVERIEKIWNKKLEDQESEDDQPDEPSDQSDDD